MKLQKRSELPLGDYFSLSVWTRGVKKRCRKASREMIGLGYLPMDQVKAIKEDDAKTQELEAIAIKAVKDTMRTFTEDAEISFSKVTIESDCLKALMFDDANFHHSIKVA